MSQRYVVRQDRDGWDVIDRWTGEAAVVAMAAQTKLSEPDAQHVARLLNQRANRSERSVSA